MPTRITTPPLDKFSRTVRTILQVGLWQLVLQAYNAFAAVPLNEAQYAILTTLGTACLTLLQNYLEDAGAIPSYGKSPPSTGQNPQPLPPTS